MKVIFPVGKNRPSAAIRALGITRPAGLEPATFGFEVRHPKNTTTRKQKTCQATQQQLTPQLTPKSPKQPKIDTSELPSDLAEIVAVWPELPAHIRAAIKALVQTHNTENE